jgi:antitoxin (DNA-binding transcriptional repressor) of toxin-antitoxin stability system
MNNITIKQLEKNFDEILDRVEKGESFLITSPKGDVVMVPHKDHEELDDLLRIHTDHEEGC